MPNVIRLEDAKRLREELLENDFDKSFKKIIKLQKISEREDLAEDEIISSTSAKNWFERKISNEIFQKRMFAHDVFLCGMYVAKILGEFEKSLPKYEYAVDFFQQWSDSKNECALKCGGDFCFLLCSVFPQRGNRRLMKTDYYQEMGRSFYYHFYTVSEKPIGSYMSSKFETMTGIVQSVLGKNNA
jgi:hypothetical protein